MTRLILPLLMSALVLAGCAGRQEKIEAQNRRPLRDIFPPPSLEAGTDKKTVEPAAPAATASAPATGATRPQPASPERHDRAAAAAAPSPSAAPPESVEPVAKLKGPSLEHDKPLFEEDRTSPADEAMGVGGGNLAEEFGMKPSAPVAPGAGEPALAEGPGPSVEPLPGAAAQGKPAPATPSAAPAGAPSTPAAASNAATAPAKAATPATTPTAAPSTAPTAAPTTGPKQAPRIVFSTRPALLVPVYGEPRLKPVEGTALMRVENSPAIILKGKSGNYYIPVYEGFVQSKRLSGPWTVTKSVPKVLTAAKAKLLAAGQQDLFAARPDPHTGRAPSLKLGVPRVLVSSQPTALIVVDGQPGYQKVRNTNLSRLVNTQARVFRNDADGSVYVQIGEDWYRAKSTSGPWKFIPANELPADFDAVKAG